MTQIVLGILLAIAAAIGVRALLVAREAQLPATAHPVAPAPSDDPIERLLLRGRKIDAIKAYREAHDVGLAEAKRAVERLARSLEQDR
jgi:ribosomal protein L7/L12